MLPIKVDGSKALISKFVQFFLRDWLGYDVSLCVAQILGLTCTSEEPTDTHALVTALDTPSS